jgi:hypothetical protein
MVGEMMTRRRVLAPLGAAFVLAGCASEPQKAVKKEPEKPPEPVTGRYAFYQMFGVARTWAQDIQGLRLRSVRIEQAKDATDGKAGAWEVTFVSPSRQRARTYTGQRGQTIPFNIQAFKIDSDEAYKVAVGKSAEYIKKFPDKPVIFQLEQTPRHPNLAWRVIWGESISTSNYSIYVDASTGAYLETGR